MLRMMSCLLALIVMLQGCVSAINYKDPNLTLNDFTEQMAGNRSPQSWNGKQSSECTYVTQVRRQFPSRNSGSSANDPVDSIIKEYERYCTVTKGGSFVRGINSCGDHDGNELFSVKLDSRPEQEFYLQMTGSPTSMEILL
ncbi:MAG TPA: hypothetical protein DEQ20_05525 [Desulfobulbaceae bacterium]|nr:MAG: hypothetical protein A2520_02115 [Deltaproteobacteria bacterium RIFOXYD12_FULL_53_23]HCC54369.1 hypothetical protein [Desulfobulbaceae bacterium]